VVCGGRGKEKEKRGEKKKKKKEAAPVGVSSWIVFDVASPELHTTLSGPY